jgi:hypothetical protein
MSGSLLGKSINQPFEKFSPSFVAAHIHIKLRGSECDQVPDVYSISSSVRKKCAEDR